VARDHGVESREQRAESIEERGERRERRAESKGHREESYLALSSGEGRDELEVDEENLELGHELRRQAAR
jgi:hypothetical protein